MFLSITCNRSGEALLLRRLSPSESLDLRAHVTKWAEAEYGEFEDPIVPSFSEPGSHIPSGCGAFEAEIRDTKAPGSSCWTSEPFFMVPVNETALAAPI